MIKKPPIGGFFMYDILQQINNTIMIDFISQRCYNCAQDWD